MLGVEIDPVGGDEGALPPGGAGGSGRAERVGGGSLDTGVFSDVSQSGDHREPGGQGQQPEDEIRPPGPGQGEAQQDGGVEQQEGGDAATGDDGTLGEILVAFRGEGLEGEQHPLFEEGLAGEVAADLAAQGGAGDGEGGRQHEIGVLGLLRIFVVRQMVGAVGGERGSHGNRAQPLAEDVIQPPVQRQAAVRGLMHQDGEAQLAGTDDGDTQRDQKGPEHGHCHGGGDDGPAVQHQQGADPRRACLERRPVAGREKVGRPDAGRGGHEGRIRPEGADRKLGLRSEQVSGNAIRHANPTKSQVDITI